MPLDRAHLNEADPFVDRRRPVSSGKSWGVVLITAAILAAVGGGFYWYQHSEAQKAASRLAAPRPPTPVAAATAELQPVPKYLSGIGTLQAMRQVTLAPEIGGRVIKIFFEPGQTVNAGDPLVQLNDAPERGDLANYQAQARLATVNLGRAKELNARNFQSQQSVDQQQMLLDQAQAGIAKVEAQIAQKMIRAPFAGQLGVRQVNLGGYINPGGPIVTLTDLSELWVNFTLPEQAASQLKVGQAARIRADAYPGKIFEAKVTAIEPQISAQTRTILVQATMGNPERLLMPGMFASVDVVLPDRPDLIVIPETAVDYSLYGDSVFLIREDKDASGKTVLRVTRTFVRTGDRFDGKVAILSGLKPGDRVAAAGQVKLNNEAPVVVQQGDSLSKLPETTAY